MLLAEEIIVVQDVLNSVKTKETQLKRKQPIICEYGREIRS
jgi:hypothetical protein